VWPFKSKQLDRIEATVNKIERIITQDMSALDDQIAALQTAVANETSVDQSAITLLNGIPALIQAAVTQAQAAGATPAQLKALTDLGTTIGANATGLAAAVTANTPPPPTP
jgi:hypothetical protein